MPRPHRHSKWEGREGRKEDTLSEFFITRLVRHLMNCKGKEIASRRSSTHFTHTQITDTNVVWMKPVVIRTVRTRTLVDEHIAQVVELLLSSFLH